MRMMQMLFHDMICQHKCAIYMGDLIFKGKTKEELRQNTLEGLKILKNNLYIKAIGKLTKSQSWDILWAKDTFVWKPLKS